MILENVPEQPSPQPAVHSPHVVAHAKLDNNYYEDLSLSLSLSTGNDVVINVDKLLNHDHSDRSLMHTGSRWSSGSCASSLSWCVCICVYLCVSVRICCEPGLSGGLLSDQEE